MRTPFMVDGLFPVRGDLPFQARGQFGGQVAAQRFEDMRDAVGAASGVLDLRDPHPPGSDRAGAHVRESLAAASYASPGWAAATAVQALAEAPTTPGDAAARAHDLLDRVPVQHLRGTTRERLDRLTSALPRDLQAGYELRERLRELPPAVDTHGQPPTP
ncbi:hypothetical protein [Embleya scabrispora]|uniref:hypothetical protein n=1 Tax=Embleya scabrispora TaxID=159449 RepID=UPI000375F86F|nr:hypothetical protein [Embleya scabrispora]MYS79195.1 hypothetical protein [Streptomyces sp. SID5474]